MSVTTKNIYSVMDAINKNDKSTQTIDKTNKTKIASPYSQNSSEPVKTNTVNTPNEEVFDVPKKTVSQPQRSGAMVNPYYTYSGKLPSNGESALLKLKREMEEKSALNPNFNNTNEAKYIKGVSNEVRKNYGLSDSEHGSGVSADYVNSIHNLDGKTNYINPEATVKSGDATLDGNVSNALKIYNLKKAYEANKAVNPNFDSTDYAKYLNQEAERIRKNNLLPEELKGTGITADELLAKINYVIDSPEFKSAKADRDYLDVLKRYDNEKNAILTTEDKKRAILSYIEAQEQAGNIIKPQAEQAISDTINSQDTAAIRRGMYGQVPASVLKANALANTQNQINSQINNMALDLIERDDAKATEEYNIRQQNKQNKLSAFEQFIASEREKRDIIKAQAENEIAKKAAEAQSAWEQKVYNDGLEQQAFDNDIEIDKRDEAWYKIGLDEENMRHDNALADDEFTLKAYDTEFDNNLNYEKFEQDKINEANNLALGYYKANKSGSESSSSNTGGISKDGANYIDNYLMPKINNVLKDKYGTGSINGKKGAYSFNGIYKIKAYEDIIANEILKSGLSNSDAEILLDMMNISDEAISKYLL